MATGVANGTFFTSLELARQDRIGKVTPIHIFTSGDEVELFLNGKSLGRKEKGLNEYRLRWDDVIYEPGEVKAVSYKNGQKWAEEIIKTRC